MNYHSGFVSIIGRPNVGKSTLLNALIGEKISIISNKPQTTRNRIHLIYTDEKMQAIFIDTPGVQMPKNELGESMLKVSTDALEGIDVCIFMTDMSKKVGKLDHKILQELEKLKDTPIILVLNKIDVLEEAVLQATGNNKPQKLSKENNESIDNLEQKKISNSNSSNTEASDLFELPFEIDATKSVEQQVSGYIQELIDKFDEMNLFQKIIPISAKNQKNTNSLLDTIYELLPEGPMFYPDDMITDRSERFIISEIIREKCLNNMSEEIPHGIFVGIEEMKKRPNKELWDIHATIFCEKDSHKGMVIGKQGKMLGLIGKQARLEIERFLDCKVNLKLWVKVEKNWRKKKNKVKQFGYE